jgi:hypothetical protein
MHTNINISEILVLVITLVFNSSIINSQNKKNNEIINFIEHNVTTNFDRVSGLFIADIDNDNDQDIIGAAINDNEVAWWRNDGGNPIQWTKEVIDDNYGGAIYLCAEDINGDGHLDIIATAAIAHQVCWWSNSGGVPIQWTKHLIVSNYTEAHGIIAIDLDKDQKMDILSTAAALNKITWWKNETGTGLSWIEQTIDNNFNYTQSISAGDFNLDGHTDIVAAALNAHQIAWYKNDGGNPVQWIKNTIANNFSMAHSVEVCEINGDSLPDILGVAYGAHEISYWQNMGGNPITWEKHSIDNSYSGPLEVCAADIDCDGDVDVAGTAGIGDEVAWWSNEGGNPVQWVKHNLASNFYDAWPISLADIDNDGDIDIVAGSSTLDEIRWWENLLITTVVGNSKNPVPGQFELFNNYPNPFNPKTTIRYTLPASDIVSIKVFNALGNEIKILLNEEKQAGSYDVEWNADGYSSGIYFYSLAAGNFRETKKMILLK